MAAKDKAIREAVRAKLAQDPQLAGAHITVLTEEGIVLLSGAVLDREQKVHAEDEARQVDGVEDVENSLRIGESQRGTGRWWDALTGEDYKEAHERLTRLEQELGKQNGGGRTRK